MAADDRSPERLGYRQLSIIFNPWASGHTTASVVTVDYRDTRRIVHRVGSIDLPVGRLDLRGLTAEQVTALLVGHLSQWLSLERATLPRPPAPAPPDGGHGGEPETRWTQPSLNLDLTV